MKIYTFLIFGILIAFGIKGRGQEKVLRDKQMYKHPGGKLYINKDLPVYLRIATSPDDDAESIQLDSESTSQYTNPMYFDTEGINTIRSPWAIDTATKKMVYPAKDIIFEVYADSKPPLTKASYGNTLKVVDGDTVRLAKNTRITLEAKDEMSGIQVSYFSIDGKPYEVYKDGISLPGEGEFEIRFYSIDNVGNDEIIHHKKIIIDGSDLSTSLEVEGEQHDNFLSAGSVIVLIPPKGMKKENIYYSVDDNQKKKYTYNIKASSLPEGRHTITYYAVDNWGNKEEDKKYEFVIDKTPPALMEEMIGKSFVANGKEYSSGRTKLKLTSFDNLSGVKEVYYSINGDEYQLYEEPFYLSHASGRLILKTYAIDNVGNKSVVKGQTSSEDVPYIDLSGPSTRFGFKGPTFIIEDTVYISAKTGIELMGEDGESGLDYIEYQLDSGVLERYETPFSIISEGQHTISFNAYDNVSNNNQEQFNVMVDTTGPEIYFRFSTSTRGIKIVEGHELKVYPAHVSLFLSATDENTGLGKISFSLNGLEKGNYKGDIQQFKPGEVNEIKVRVPDKLGNLTRDSVRFWCSPR